MGQEVNEEMLAVVEIKYIRHEANTKGHSYAEIARRIKRDPRTVQKYAEMEEFNPKPKVRKKKAPVMDPVKPIIDRWLREDLNKKRKYRRTAKRMWQQLQEHHQFKGSYRSVRHYISTRKQELLEERKAAIPLESKPGTAQVDFGEAPFKLRGKIVDLPYLVLSFPYSNAFYVQVFPSQNRECFLEGLKRMFHHMGGVPRVIRFDNLAPAVKKVLPHGERELTEEFERFLLHYGFQYEFCNPASGHEKGHVEAMVKYVRNNIFLPERSVEHLEGLNKQLWKMAEEDRHRTHYEKGATISELFKEDRGALLVLPAKAYEVVRYESLKADKYGMVTIDSNRYSTSPRFANRTVVAKISYDSIEILTNEYESIVSHSRCYGKHQRVMKWQPYLRLMAKRPRAMKYTDFYGQLPPEWQDYLTKCTRPEQQRALKLLAEILKHHDLSYATEALVLASQYGHPTDEAIKQVFYQLIHGRGQRPDHHSLSTLPKMPDVTRDLKRYDRLGVTRRG